MTSWTRRNARWLIACVVLLPLVTAVSFSDGWRAYRDTEWRVPYSASGADAADFAGVRWSLLSLDDESARLSDQLPAASALVVATFQLDGSTEALGRIQGCAVRLTDGSRYWEQPDSGDVTWDTDDGFGVGCGDTEGGEPRKVQVAFLVPADAVPLLLERGQVQIALSDRLPEYVTLQP